MSTMSSIPALSTDRLLLRAFEQADADAVSKLVTDPAVSRSISRTCIPYADMDQWIDQQQINFEEANYLTLAVTRREDGVLLGSATMTHYETDVNAELDYWIGRPYWRRGYATEACCALIDYILEPWALHRIFACHFATNPASGRVLEKLGFTREGALRQHHRTDHTFEDLVYWGLLRNEWRP